MMGRGLFAGALQRTFCPDLTETRGRRKPSGGRGLGVLAQLKARRRARSSMHNGWRRRAYDDRAPCRHCCRATMTTFPDCVQYGVCSCDLASLFSPTCKRLVFRAITMHDASISYTCLAPNGRRGANAISRVAFMAALYKQGACLGLHMICDGDGI
jgi:hypothetical protein